MCFNFPFKNDIIHNRFLRFICLILIRREELQTCLLLLLPFFSRCKDKQIFEYIYFNIVNSLLHPTTWHSYFIMILELYFEESLYSTARTISSRFETALTDVNPLKWLVISSRSFCLFFGVMQWTFALAPFYILDLIPLLNRYIQSVFIWRFKYINTGP